MGTPWTPFGFPWAPLGRPWPRLGHPLGTLGHPSCYFNRPVGDIGHCRADIWIPRGNPLAPFGHTLEATSAILETCLQKGQKNNFFGLPLGTLLGTGAYVIRPRLRSPNTHLGIIFDTVFHTSKKHHDRIGPHIQLRASATHLR